jgi:type IV pilus assembly protein PilV
MLKPPPSKISRESGFTMMEVLVAVVIVSFGLLGFASMLTKAIQDNRVAYMRSQATVLAYDITERMRANRSEAITGGYTIGLGANASGTTMAALDTQDWKNTLAQILPGGDGSVNVDGNGNATIIIRWDEDGDGIATLFTTQTSI